MQSGLRITTAKLLTICGLTGVLVSFVAVRDCRAIC